MLDNNPPFNVMTQAFPHIGVKLKEYGGSGSFEAYMEGLLYDTRGGKRRGLTSDVLMALNQLTEQHQTAYPQYVVDFGANAQSKSGSPARQPASDS